MVADDINLLYSFSSSLPRSGSVYRLKHMHTLKRRGSLNLIYNRLNNMRYELFGPPWIDLAPWAVLSHQSSPMYVLLPYCVIKVDRSGTLTNLVVLINYACEKCSQVVIALIFVRWNFFHIGITDVWVCMYMYWIELNCRSWCKFVNLLSVHNLEFAGCRRLAIVFVDFG